MNATARSQQKQKVNSKLELCVNDGSYFFGLNRFDSGRASLISLPPSLEMKLRLLASLESISMAASLQGANDCGLIACTENWFNIINEKWIAGDCRPSPKSSLENRQTNSNSSTAHSNIHNQRPYIWFSDTIKSSWASSIPVNTLGLFNDAPISAWSRIDREKSHRSQRSHRFFWLRWR